MKGEGRMGPEDTDLERLLREGAPEPGAEFVRATVERVGWASGRRIGRGVLLRPLSAIVLSAVLVAVVVAFGGVAGVKNSVKQHGLSPFIAAACSYSPTVTSITPNTDKKMPHIQGS